MKISLLTLVVFLLCGCSNNSTIEVEDNDQVTVCGKVEGEKQTYPTLGDLKADGAKLLYYGPCY